MADDKNEVGVEEAIQPTEPAAVPPSTTVHEAELAPGPSGAVEYGKEIDEAHSDYPASGTGRTFWFVETKRRRIVPGPTKSRPR